MPEMTIFDFLLLILVVGVTWWLMNTNPYDNSLANFRLPPADPFDTMDLANSLLRQRLPRDQALEEEHGLMKIAVDEAIETRVNSDVRIEEATGSLKHAQESSHDDIAKLDASTARVNQIGQAVDSLGRRLDMTSDDLRDMSLEASQLRSDALAGSREALKRVKDMRDTLADLKGELRL